MTCIRPAMCTATGVCEKRLHHKGGEVLHTAFNFNIVTTHHGNNGMQKMLTTRKLSNLIRNSKSRPSISVVKDACDRVSCTMTILGDDTHTSSIKHICQH